MFRDTHPPHHHHAIGRHRHGRHFGERGGGGRHGEDGFSPFGRKLSSEDLQLVLLALLAEQPAHGYELIRTLEQRSAGFYTPSSGMVYPALAYLDDVGHTESNAEANRRLYTITQAGRDHLAGQREQADAILAALARIGARMADVRDTFAGVHESDPAFAALHEARSRVKHALREVRGCSAEQARRVAGILEEAAERVAAALKAASG